MLDKKAQGVVAKAASGQGTPRHIRPVWKRKQLRHDAMRLQFAPPNSGNKALLLHARLTSKPKARTR